MQNTKKLLSPKLDIVFHPLFREENKELFANFLSSVLKKDVSVKTIDKSRFANVKQADDKLSVMDLRAELENGEYCHFEVQLNYFSSIIRRIQFYAYETYVRQLKRGHSYDELKPTTTVLLIDDHVEELETLGRPIGRWRPHEDYTDETISEKVLTASPTIVIIELPNAKEWYKKEPTNPLYQWLMFFDDPNSEEVKEIMEQNKYIEEAMYELEQISGNEELRLLAELKEKTRRDQEATLEYAIQKGIKEGIEKGIEEGMVEGLEKGREEGREKIKEIISNMQDAGFSVEQIANITKLSEEEVKKLLEK